MTFRMMSYRGIEFAHLFKRKKNIKKGGVKKNLLSIPHRGENVKQLKWDHSLQKQNIFMAFKKVPRW